MRFRVLHDKDWAFLLPTHNWREKGIDNGIDNLCMAILHHVPNAKPFWISFHQQSNHILYLLMYLMVDDLNWNKLFHQVIQKVFPKSWCSLLDVQIYPACHNWIVICLLQPNKHSLQRKVGCFLYI